MFTTTVKKAEKKGAVRSVTIRIAENGYTVECDREMLKTEGKCMDMCWSPPKPAVFDGPDAGEKALNYIATELGLEAAESKAA